MILFDALGFKWDRNAIPNTIPVYSLERVCFHFYKMLPEYVWAAGVLEGNPFTFPEVKTLLDGITVGGHKLSDQDQILNLAESTKILLKLVKSRCFTVNKQIFIELNNIISRNESLEWGIFRGEGKETNYTPNVILGEHGRYTPLPTIPRAPKLNRLFSEGVEILNECPPFERAMAFFLFGALHQFFFDGNKRTSRLMMNGILLSNGLDAISIPASQAQVFNEKMVRFYKDRDGTEMMAFLINCHPEAEKILTDSSCEEETHGMSL